MLKEAQAIKPQLVAWRRAIHSHPELGFDVYRTADLVAKALAEMGVEARVGVGKTGVVGYLGNGGGPVIGIRADMDALPILEENNVAYASEISGCMHACGHDAHTAMLLGVARLLHDKDISGQVRLLFQPSEEDADEHGISGAPAMISDGALDGVDAVIALHVNGTVDVGNMRADDGWVGAAVDTFRGHVIGRGGHAAYPHEALDPIWLSSQVLNALYAIPSRRISPLLPSVITVGIVRGGTADNVIPQSVYIEGTIRSMDEQVRSQLAADIERAFNMARAFGGDYQLNIIRGYPAQWNEPQVAGWLRAVAGDLLGEDAILTGQQSMGAEDFSYMTQRAPGAMFGLGVRQPGGVSRYLHTATFDIDEDALPIGAAILAETALRFVRGELG